MSTWDNFDGLKVKFGLDRAEENPKGRNTVQATNHMTVSVDLVNGNHALTDVSEWDAYVPAGSAITKATLVVTEAIAGAGTETVTIGLAQPDQTVIDADGIDAAIAFGALGSGAVVNCDGALVGGTSTIGSNRGVVYVTPSAATLTAGKADLVIEYVGVGA